MPKRVKNILIYICTLMTWQIISYNSAHCLPSSSQTDKQLHVVIVAISKFDDPAWNNALLEENIVKASGELEAFFHNKFPQAVLHILRSREETTSDSIRRLLRVQLPDFGKGSLTLMFFLSHGESFSSANPLYPHDLMIVTSDTQKSKIAEKALFAGKDVIADLQGLPKGSVVLAFFDTCYSGSAESPAVSIQGALQNILGVKMMVIASALPEEKAYQATFTQALLKLWQSDGPNPNCTASYQAPSLIREKIKSMIALEPNQGHPKVVIPYYGNLCLESFSAHNSIIFFYNTSTESLASRIRKYSDGGDPQTWEVALDGETVTPVKLNRGKYNLQVFWQNQQVAKEEVDLQNQPVSFQTVGQPKNLIALGVAYEKAAKFADDAGIAEREVLELRKRSFASYVNGKDHVAASRVLVEILKVERPNSRWNLAREAAFNPLQNVLESMSANDINGAEKATVAEQLKLTGDFNNAAKLFAAAAKEVNDKNQAREFAIQAYFTFGAANQPAEANQVRKQFKLPISDECKQCPAAEKDALSKKSFEAGSAFKSLSTAIALETKIPLDQNLAGGVNPDNVEGRYDLRIIAANQGVLNMTLTIRKNELGELATSVENGGDLNITRIEVLEGGAINLTLTNQTNQGTAQIILEGRRDGSNMSGKWESGGFSGTWEAKKK